MSGRKSKGGFREARLISQALALEEHAPPRFVSLGVTMVVALIAVAGKPSSDFCQTFVP